MTVVLSLALLSTCAAAQEPITIRMHGVLRSKGTYLSTTDAAKVTGRLYEGRPAVVTHIRDASTDPLQYCVVVDAGQKPEVNEPIRRAAADLIRAVARPGDRGRAIVFGKSMKNSVTHDWDTDAAALAAFVNTPLDAKGSDPYAPLVDCVEHFESVGENRPAIRAIFVVGGRPTEASPWSTEWLLQRFARLDIQLYLVSFDPGLLTGGEMQKTTVEPPRRRRWSPYTPPLPTDPRNFGWYAPSLYRVARDSAGDVIFASQKQPQDFSGFTARLRHQVEVTLLASEKDANTYRDFKLSAPDIDVQVSSVLYVPKR